MGATLEGRRGGAEGRQRVTDPITTIVEDCRTYWREVGLSRATVDDMARELETHLREAAADGRSPENVVGTECAHHLDIAGTANAMYFGAERPGNLHRIGSNAARCAVNQDFFSRR